MSQEKRNLLKPVKPQVHFPQLEESILEFWEKNQIFQASLNSHSKKSSQRYQEKKRLIQSRLSLLRQREYGQTSIRTFN